MRYKREKVFRKVLIENYKMIKFVAGVTALFIPIVIVYAILSGGLGENLVIFAVAAAVFEVFNVGYIIIANNKLALFERRRRPKNATLVFRSYWLLFLIIIMGIYSLGMEDSMDMLTYLLITAIISFVPIMSGGEYAVATVLQLGITGVVTYTKGILADNYLEILLITIICGLLSRILYKNKMELYLLKKRIKSITQDALVDPLTGLLNRRGFEQQVRNIWPFCMRNEYKVALMIIDIDNFKEYNDFYGHPQGDVCLQRVAEEIRITAKRTTDITARMGGEEFVIFFQGNKNEEIIAFAERMRQNIEDLRIKHSSKVERKYVTVSIGLAISSPTKIDVERLYDMADKELYNAKKTSRNAISYMGTVRNKNVVRRA